ncbi:MAG: Hpt domain-containing protein [Oscillospiraceae bacterium]
MQGFKVLFEAYGADYQTTMNRFMGNETLYLKLLDMLFRDTNLQRLGAALDANDLSDAFAAAHTLKGVVGNMGLTPLYSAVCAIVEPLRKREQRTIIGAVPPCAEFTRRMRFGCVWGRQRV